MTHELQNIRNIEANIACMIKHAQGLQLVSSCPDICKNIREEIKQIFKSGDYHNALTSRLSQYRLSTLIDAIILDYYPKYKTREYWRLMYDLAKQQEYRLGDHPNGYYPWLEALSSTYGCEY